MVNITKVQGSQLLLVWFANGCLLQRNCERKRATCITVL